MIALCGRAVAVATALGVAGRAGGAGSAIGAVVALMGAAGPGGVTAGAVTGAGA
ncbi:hypothetical protein [Nocardia jejuensis]|uniref:hypothetical protein n=1 Tax=Nocardia jejuensis TaxID=328049 RepID=UPI0012FBE4F5|nr:hypothetical protein [Nocardia jejuensis]